MQPTKIEKCDQDFETFDDGHWEIGICQLPKGHKGHHDNTVYDRQKESEASEMTTEKWIEGPNTQGYWWHSYPDQLPVIYHVQVSKTGRDRYFIDHPDSRWCDEIGGLWTKVAEPTEVQRG